MERVKRDRIKEATLSTYYIHPLIVVAYSPPNWFISIDELISIDAMCFERKEIYSNSHHQSNDQVMFSKLIKVVENNVPLTVFT